MGEVPSSGGSSESEHRPAIRLDDYLVDILAGRIPPTSPPPRSINLGEFGREAERLIKLSLSDPQHPEYASFASIDAHERVFLLSQPIRGNEHQVSLPEHHDKRSILTIHTHGDTDTPFSPYDLEGLLLDHADQRSTPAALLATPSTKVLIMRTHKTPLLSPREVQDATVMMDLDPAMEQEWEHYRRRYEADGGEDIDRPPPFKDGDKYILQQLSANRMYLLIHASHEFNLIMYSCLINDNVALLVN